MIFVDTSFYLPLLNPKDTNYKKALNISKSLKNPQLITSQAVLGEVLTVGSMRINKKKTIRFVSEIMGGATKIILEKPVLIDMAWKKFKKIKSKNVSWVDCFSITIIEKLKIEKLLAFDQDFRKYCSIEIIGG